MNICRHLELQPPDFGGSQQGLNCAYAVWTTVNTADTISHMNPDKEWLDKATGGDSLHEVNRRTGLNYSGLSRKFREGKELSAEQVIAVARGYGLDPVQALRDTGFLPQAPQEETPEQLAERIKADVDRLASKLHDTNVIPLHPKNAPDVAADFYNQETPTDFPFSEAVAKDSEDLDSWEEDDDTP